MKLKELGETCSYICLCALSRKKPVKHAVPLIPGESCGGVLGGLLEFGGWLSTVLARQVDLKTSAK